MKKNILIMTLKVHRLFSILFQLSIILSACSVSRVNTTTTDTTIKDLPSTSIMEINSSPQGAKVYQDGRFLGITPCQAEVQLSWEQGSSQRVLERNAIRLTFVHDNYETEIEKVYPKKDAVSYPNMPYIYNGGIFYKGYSFPSGAFHVFQKRKTIVDTTVPSGTEHEMVTRENAGGTSLEKTIIRWYFDSAPKGARVFWRVISSVPAEVKNTNELYLGTTPYEETRSFNILGLTYSNSRDVQIEVKVSRKGYMDQVKRFNVRQAIDQQEISSFFDLVEE